MSKTIEPDTRMFETCRSAPRDCEWPTCLCPRISEEAVRYGAGGDVMLMGAAFPATPGYAEPGSTVGMSPNYRMPRDWPRDEPEAVPRDPEWPPKRDLDLGDDDGKK